MLTATYKERRNHKKVNVNALLSNYQLFVIFAFFTCGRWHCVYATVFGRPFVKRFALWYRSVVCPVCLSVLSVTFVYCGQTVGRIKMKLSTQVGLGLGITHAQKWRYIHFLTEICWHYCPQQRRFHYYKALEMVAIMHCSCLMSNNKDLLTYLLTYLLT